MNSNSRASGSPDGRGDMEESVTSPATEDGPERELSHEDFDPKGTLALILVYFVILTFMWVFMYFVEFLGNEFVVVG
jgi:hypothetical protein